MANTEMRKILARTPRRRARGDFILLVVVILAAIAVALIVLQLGVLLYTAFHAGELFGGTGLTLSHLLKVVTDHNFTRTLINTIVISVGTVAVMAAVSVPAAWVYARTNFRGRRILIFIFTANMAIPGFLVAMSYSFLLNPSNGIANLVIRGTSSDATGPINVYSIGWIIVLQGLTLAGAAFFMMVPSFQTIDSSLEEAAATCGIGRYVMLRKIFLPLALPAILGTSIYYFVVALEMFDYAAVLGMPRQILVFSTLIFRMITPSGGGLPDYQGAAAVGIIFTVAAVFLTLLYFRWTGEQGKYAVVGGKATSENRLELSKLSRSIIWIGMGLVGSLTLVVPLVTLVWSSLIPYLQVPSLSSFSRLTTTAYQQALTELPPLLHSTVILVIAAPTIAVLLGIAVSWIVTRTRLWGRKLIDIVVMAAVGIPAIVSALAFLYAGLAAYRWLPVYGSIWLLVIAFSARFMTWAVRSLNSAFIQIGGELEEAGSVFGLKRGLILLRITLPIVLPSVLFSWYWVALLCVRELGLPVLLVRGNTQVLATAIFGFDSGGSTAVAAAIGVLLISSILVIVGIGQVLTARRGSVPEGA